MIDINVLRGLGTIRKFKKGDTIFYEGENGNEMYIVLSGKVDIYIDSFKDTPVHDTSVNPGEFFGEMCMLNNHPRSVTAQAAKNTVLLAIPQENFEDFIQKQPYLTHKIMKSLSLRVQNLTQEVRNLQEQVKELENGKSQQNMDTKVSQSSKDSSDSNTVQLKIPIFPPEHKTYDVTAPESDNEYLFDKQVKCPVCKEKFSLKMFRITKLRMDNQDHDFRRRYVDFEPLWYSIWVCPNCLYSNHYFDFESFPKESAGLLMQKTQQLKESISADFSTPRTIDQVFTSYYLALYCADVYSVDPLKPAKLWLQLSWLYKDVGDSEMFKIASSSALEYYYNAYYNHSLDISTQDEQQLCIIIGELLLLKGDVKEAVKHFYKAINNKSGVPKLNQQAQDRIQDVKHNYKDY